MVRKDDIVAYVKNLAGVSIAEEKGMLVFRRGEKIFAMVEDNTDPLRVEMRCDRKLSSTLQERYESVMESRMLGRNGIEVICSGQLSNDEIIDLVRHSYEQSKEDD